MDFRARIASSHLFGKGKARILGLTTLISFLLFLVFLVQNIIFPLPIFKLEKLPSVSTYSSEGRLLRVFISGDGRYRMRVKLNEINPFLLKAIIAYEDRYFFYHFGVNPFSLVRAFMTNIKAGKIVCGGSTITMQIARMMEPKERNIFSKLIEIFRALQLELRYSKKELLEIYFNLAPYGGNIEGVQAASYLYFGKPPGQLSKGEVCLLVALPRNPEKTRPDKYFKNAHKIRKNVARRLLSFNLISKKGYDEIINEPLPKKRKELPFFAPHLAQIVKSIYPDKSIIITTLNYNLQIACEKLAKEYILPLRKTGITNLSVVVIENKTYKVKALVGSACFFDEKYSGQVNGGIAPRSPGSTLKPFLYAISLDEGIITPKMVIPDLPVDYTGYSPENYDGKYRGVVTCEEALFQSLNIPAVTLYSKTKNKFFNFLKEGGITTINKAFSHYGLALILGSCEVSLLELTNLYAGIANLGKFSSYRLIEDNNPPAEKRLLSLASCYIISEILAKGERPDLPSIWEATVDLPKIAWKTGTSYGRRDAWTIGYNPDYTVGVWIGNFSGEGHENLVGGEVATPLLFDLFKFLTKNLYSEKWFSKPEGVSLREVCAISGLPKGEFCDVGVEDFYIPGASTNKKCDFHKIVLIDNKTGYRLCPVCKQHKVYHERLFIQYPPQLATYFERNGYPVPKIPSHYPDCTTFVENKAPVIRSPSENGNYYVTDDVKEEYQRILFEASAPNSIKKIHWLVDGRLFSSKSPTEKVFYTPTAGKHKITCIDNEGNSSEVAINVVMKRGQPSAER
ncbi:MAG: penicillin-binding protein 1C [bacterium]|nr:penicillin-binding protein 1C [bacterium]